MAEDLNGCFSSLFNKEDISLATLKLDNLEEAISKNERVTYTMTARVFMHM